MMRVGVLALLALVKGGAAQGGNVEPMAGENATQAYPCDPANDGPLFMEMNFCNDTVIAVENNGYDSCEEMFVDMLFPSMTPGCQDCVSMTNGSWQGCIDYLDTVPVFECAAG
eukprot:COSAG02_NODE_31974_length_524_cov_0.915294_1_plen_112_part_10